MKIVLAATAVLSLSACFGAPAEPLSSTLHKGNVTQPAAKGSQLPLLSQHVTLKGDATTTQPDFQHQAVAELAATVSFASVQAYALADAGRSHDVLAVENAAIALADAAATVQQRASEMQTDGCEAVVTPEDVNNAVTVSALAAEVGGQIGDDLNPPADQSCTQVCNCEGCADQCTQVPGNVDETVLSQDINDASDVAAGCADASDNLAAAL